MKRLTVVFFLFSAFAIVMAHSVIPHHHHQPGHIHEHEHPHPSHHHHPFPESHADHHNLYTWFIHGKKELTYSPTHLSCTPFCVRINNCRISLPDANVKKIKLPPELNIDFTGSDYCNNQLLRAPPLFRA